MASCPTCERRRGAGGRRRDRGVQSKKKGSICGAGKKKILMSVGFEPTPFRTSDLTVYNLKLAP